MGRKKPDDVNYLLTFGHKYRYKVKTGKKLELDTGEIKETKRLVKKKGHPLVYPGDEKTRKKLIESFNYFLSQHEFPSEMRHSRNMFYVILRDMFIKAQITIWENKLLRRNEKRMIRIESEDRMRLKDMKRHFLMFHKMFEELVKILRLEDKHVSGKKKIAKIFLLLQDNIKVIDDIDKLLFDDDDEDLLEIITELEMKKVDFEEKLEFKEEYVKNGGVQNF